LATAVLRAAGRGADGLAYLDRTIAGIDERGIGFYLPEIYRLHGKRSIAPTKPRRSAISPKHATSHGSKAR
jgi:hypothetical protein